MGVRGVGGIWGEARILLISAAGPQHPRKRSSVLIPWVKRGIVVGLWGFRRRGVDFGGFVFNNLSG